MWYLHILSKQLNKIAELLIQNGVGFFFFFFHILIMERSILAYRYLLWNKLTSSTC